MTGYDMGDAEVPERAAADSLGIPEATETVHGPNPPFPARGSTRTRLRHRRRRLSAELRDLPDDHPRHAVLVDEIARLAALERLLPRRTPQ